jgi:uncharacterized RDD family membrane protein YckC
VTHPSELPTTGAPAWQLPAQRPAQPPGYGNAPMHGYAYPGGYPPFVPQVPLARGGAPLAGFGDRLLARLIDLAVLFIPSLVIEVLAFVPLFALMISSNGALNPGVFLAAILGGMVVFMGLITAMWYVYEVTMLHKTGQTIGKRLRKIKIVRVEDGEPIDKRMALRRWLVSHVAAIVAPYFNYANGLWQLWDEPYKQCLHDKCAETVVVKVAS